MPVGTAVAALLAATWRSSPPLLTISTEEAAAAAVSLIPSGAGPLCWRRLREHSDRLPRRDAELLRSAYLDSTIRGAKHEQEVAEVFRLLRSAGIEPILLKGWAVSRLYPESGLRPSGDIDVHVPPEQRSAAEAVLNRQENQRYWVDLDHDELTRFGERSWEDLYEHSQLVPLHGTAVRVLGAEDQLRALCLHFLKHGGWRPVWLCDIAAALESRPGNFDWERCLGTKAREREWVLCTIQLAGRLLDAELGDTPVSGALPAWLPTALLKQWSEPSISFLPRMITDVRRNWRTPRKLLAHVAQRWPNPIQATVDEHGAFDNSPRLPLQIRNCVVRGMRLLGSNPGD